jgi:NAD-dependent epimerase/dehydratase family protein
MTSGCGKMKLWGDGKQMRSFLFIDDAVNATLALMASEHEGPVNIGSDHAVTINHLAQLAMSAVGKGDGAISMCHDMSDTSLQGVRGRNANIALARAVLEWEPTITLPAGLRKTGEWIRDEIEFSRESAVESETTPGVMGTVDQENSHHVGILLPVTSRLTGTAVLDNLKIFAASLLKTTKRDGFTYTVYIGVDHDDEILLSPCDGRGMGVFSFFVVQAEDCDE